MAIDAPSSSRSRTPFNGYHRARVPRVCSHWYCTNCNAENGSRNGRTRYCKRYIIIIIKVDLGWQVLFIFSVYLAASDEGIVYVLSTVATSTIEEVSEAAPKGNNWFQLYIYKDR